MNQSRGKRRRRGGGEEVRRIETEMGERFLASPLQYFQSPGQVKISLGLFVTEPTVQKKTSLSRQNIMNT